MGETLLVWEGRKRAKDVGGGTGKNEGAGGSDSVERY